MQPTYSLSVAATKIDSHAPPPVTTLRTWIDQYGEYLSKHAAPPAGQQRRVTDQDIAVLRLVADLRKQGKRRGDIVARLSETKPQAGEIIAPTVQENDAQRFATPAQTAQDALLLPMLTDAMDKRLDALQRHIERVERNQRDRALIFVAGASSLQRRLHQ